LAGGKIQVIKFCPLITNKHFPRIGHTLSPMHITLEGWRMESYFPLNDSSAIRVGREPPTNILAVEHTNKPSLRIIPRALKPEKNRNWGNQRPRIRRTNP